MDIREEMIWREEHGLDSSYEATVDALAGAADHARKAEKENPPVTPKPSEDSS